MPTSGVPLRKRRTREHVIAAQSVNYVERFIIDEGHTAQRAESDYGYDLFLFTYDELGYAEEGTVFLQLKASESLPESKGGYRHDLDIRDYNRWKSEPMPVILILFDAARRCAFWLYVQRHFAEKKSGKPRKGARTVRVRIPTKQRVTRRTVARWRRLKQKILDQLEGRVHHA